ncbi:MAG: ABC transporter substrate-binding protein, partial [Candidatus Anammoxibacter sp.]
FIFSIKFSRLLLFFLLISSFGCLKNSEKRRIRQEAGDRDIVIGGVFPLNTKDHYLEGFNLAIEEINNKGGVLGRNIKTVIEDDNLSIKKGKEIARRFAKNPDVVAVVGYPFSETASPVSIIYEENHIVFVTPSATAPSLTEYGFDFVFRNIPTSRDFTRQLAQFAKNKKYDNVIIIKVNDKSGKELSNLFHIYAEDLDIEVLGVYSIEPRDKDIRGTIARYSREFNKLNFDAIFIGATFPIGAEVMQYIRLIGINAPFLGSDGLDSDEFWDVAGDAAEGTVISTVSTRENPLFNAFSKNYVAKYKSIPDVWAAQPYDAVKVLVFAMESAGSTVPERIENFLHCVKNWHGVTGIHSFDENGDVLDKKISFKIFNNRKFKYLNVSTDLDD